MSKTEEVNQYIHADGNWTPVLDVPGFIVANEPYKFQFHYTELDGVAPASGWDSNTAYSRIIYNNETSILYVRPLDFEIMFTINKE